jgi:hypothetical protein
MRNRYQRENRKQTVITPGKMRNRYQRENRKQTVITPGKMRNRLKGIFGPRFDLPRTTATARPAAAAARARVASPSSFLNFSIDSPTVHLFKLIDCLLNFQYGANQLAYCSI